MKTHIFKSRDYVFFFVVVCFLCRLQGQPPVRHMDEISEDPRRKEALESVRRQLRAGRPELVYEGFFDRIRAKVPVQKATVKFHAGSMFEGFVLDDENLERDLWEAIRENAVLAREIEPLRRECRTAFARQMASPPPDPADPFRYGRVTELDLIQERLVKAEVAKRNVELIRGALQETNDIRSVRLFAFLLWEPGNNHVDGGDVGNPCLRYNIWNSYLAPLAKDGLLDMGGKIPTEQQCRKWWLSNQWRWGWSYEIDFIRDTKVFTEPALPGTKQKPDKQPQRGSLQPRGAPANGNKEQTGDCD